MKMPSSILFIFSLTCITQLIDVQASIDYSLIDIDATINNEYTGDLETYINDDYRTLFLNFTILKPYPKDLKITFKALGTSMGEYVVKTGLHIEIDFCDIFTPNYQFIGKHAERVGYSKDDCPPGPKNYCTERFEPDVDTFPDYFIPNNYVAIIQLASKDVFISEYRAYFRVN